MESFDYKNLGKIIEVVYPLWRIPSESRKFNDIYVEYLVRKNIYLSEYSFQLSDDNGEFCSSAFLERIRDSNESEKWLLEHMGKLSAGEKDKMEVLKTYLEYMDKTAISSMSQKDIKLSLFVSAKKGWGKKLVEESFSLAASQGYEQVYLWTDCECDYEWYFNHGFTLVKQGIYEPLSTKDFDFSWYVFKKSILT